MSIQEHFAKYWELGWVAFPISLSWNISKNKKDLNPPKDWQKLDVESAKLLSPKGAIALQTGPLSGIVVVDIDDVEAWQKFLVDKGQDAPKTVTARSQRGGLHFYFRWTEELGDLKSTSALLRGCADIRSTGGMIIAPPSSFQVPGEHDRRRYTWIEGKAPWDRWLADMPLWLAQALRKSLAVHHNGKTQGVKSTAVLDGPDMAPTPDTTSRSKVY
ncbi:prim-Pol-domain-containing protein [Gonapodya prolifera JEL478]|uniref:Prim-Pol-domain-containing protein n=1 Tax=Gonapodya prolifera (strain JEL478) TaxID=1344416 RepID=A0A138ZWU8_GONPJ|nr:prim-Pol-domain-containing protein [Gonapodya prolifera JEL478]|eukprot:KXS08931.1 prim-Pol-domain-containing protein [Gonapodya prolifera JEL478]